MLIRSNRPFQDGGNRETIVPEESRPLEVPEKQNGGWKQMVGCQGYLPCSPSVFSSLSVCTFPFSCLSLAHECELTV